MRRPRSVRSVVVAVGVVAAVVAALLWWHGESATSNHASPAEPPTEAARPRDLVGLVVVERNREEHGQRRAFEDDGWTFVNVAEPDHALLAVSPALLPAREAELRAQLASAPPGVEHLANVVVVATSARDAATRIAAVEAISRMRVDAAQRALVELLPKLAANDPARRVLVPLLRPASASDESIAELIALLDSPAIASDEKEQIAMTLAMLSLRDGVPLNQPMSTAARALIERMTSLATRAHTAKRS